MTWLYWLDGLLLIALPSALAWLVYLARIFDRE
jgi:hypothetical protein